MLLRTSWIHFLATYLIFIAFWSVARNGEDMMYIPTILAAFGLYHQTQNWLFETSWIKNLQKTGMDFLGRQDSESSDARKALSVHAALLTMIYLPAMSLSWHLSKLLQ
ncbi:hypothetical protein THF1A12_50015 [Vibrio jasicida]|jgi:hypothetical protein|uniref:Transcriptional regulator n=1 Tax=Vibrio jasicida TaxID=766224 RepID=A0AAU9QSZ1_9VIBR|nr:hypothetical protein THF1A12_50015 [Vibrio jasicida]